MANPTELVNGEAENTAQNEEDAQSNEKKHDKAACADLERITDYAEDIEVSDSNIDNAMSLIEGRRSEEDVLKAEREKELSQVKVRKEDVELIVNEMEVSQTIAERKLREAGGDVVQALVLLTN
ncbi:huntingtin-interacting protein K-like [Clytia hemisphaerica]|uniref:huntingtin-interacting protein K-like n=1 Tax=Clytia hemisphaerica TaxID=252671 RepID=UPI0034D7799A